MLKMVVCSYSYIFCLVMLVIYCLNAQQRFLENFILLGRKVNKQFNESKKTRIKQRKTGKKQLNITRNYILLNKVIYWMKKIKSVDKKSL